jgi:hypothetical protein
MLTQLRLKELFNYDPETGAFISIYRRRGVKINKRSGYKDIYGYRRLMVDGERIFEHRLAWLYVYGEMPDKFVDHINGIRDDNRISNLRICNLKENSRNSKKSSRNKSGYKGVSFDSESKKWAATICLNGKNKRLGRFKNIEDAKEAYKIASIKHFGEFARQE